MKPKSRSRIDRMIGKRIKELRATAGLSQTTLGKRLGISFQQVQKYEYGTNRISAATLWKMAQLLKLDIRTFFTKI